MLKINYSTAKTILRVYRKEDRVNRKYKYSGFTSEEEKSENNNNQLSVEFSIISLIDESEKINKFDDKLQSIKETKNKENDLHIITNSETINDFNKKTDKFKILNSESEILKVLKEIREISRNIEVVKYLLQHNSQLIWLLSEYLFTILSNKSF